MPTAIFSDTRVSRDDFVERELSAGGVSVAGPVFRFSWKSVLYTMPMRVSEVGNCFHPLPRRTFDTAVIGTGMPLFHTTLTHDFLARVYNSVKPGGELLIRADALGEDPQSISLPSGALHALFGPYEERGEFLVLRRDVTELPEDRSVLSAYWANRGELVFDHIFGGSVWGAEPAFMDAIYGEISETDIATAAQPLRPSREAIAEIVALYRSGEVGPDRHYERPMMAPSPEWTFRENATQVANAIDGWLRYRLWGVYYKTAVMKKVIRDNLGSDRPLSLVEHGGNVGLIPLQMLLEPDLTVRRVVNSEISTNVLMGGSRLAEHLGHRARGRYAFAFGPAEEYSYDGEYDVVSFTQCLLYLRRDILETVLRDAYEALSPGGLLMILENTAPPTGTTGRDADIIFSPDELDSLLERVAPPRYFETKSGLPITRDDSTRTPALRVLTRS